MGNWIILQDDSQMNRDVNHGHKTSKNITMKVTISWKNTHTQKQTYFTSSKV